MAVMCPSRIPLPAPLRSTSITTLRRYYERSDSSAGGSSAHREHEHRLDSRAGLPASCATPSRPFRLHPPGVPRRRFCTLPLSERRFPARPRVEISPFASRLIAHAWPYRVCPPTDWSLPVDCSPPRLAATQLSLGSGPESVWPEGDSHPSVVAPLQAHSHRASRGGITTVGGSQTRAE